MLESPKLMNNLLLQRANLLPISTQIYLKLGTPATPRLLGGFILLQTRLSTSGTVLNVVRNTKEPVLIGIGVVYVKIAVESMRLKALSDAGRLLAAGPCPAIDSPDPGPAGFTGSVVIAEFDSLAAAQAWADADPYVAAGVSARVTVKPFKKVLPT